MTTTATTPGELAGIRLGFGGTLRSEWIKLRSVRSTVWCFGLIILLTVGFGILLATTASVPEHLEGTGAKALTVQVATLGVNFTQLIAAVLGVLVISGEYGTGMIRSTFTVVPGRISAYVAKATVLAAATFVVGLVSIGLTAVVTAPILAAQGVGGRLGDGDVLLPMLGGAGYLALIALLAFTFGAIVRNSAGGIASILGLVLVVPTVLQILGGATNAAWLFNIAAFTPSSAGGKMFAFDDGSSATATLGPGGPHIISLDSMEGLLVLIAWVVVFGVLAAILVKRRDV